MVGNEESNVFSGEGLRSLGRLGGLEYLNMSMGILLWRLLWIARVGCGGFWKFPSSQGASNEYKMSKH
jgi:hypothetical protein